ncbi:asparaginase domain-containing protein [Armatimonas sp.]|uniref:asparaginase domain-containing protein n=1 Tax=Armatimonas sp. TaxID=1872638 RepID=UPI0037524580
MMTLPRIVVIGMGGTIGMVRGAEGALHPAASVGELLGQVPAAARYAELSLLPLASLDIAFLIEL